MATGRTEKVWGGRTAKRGGSWGNVEKCCFKEDSKNLNICQDVLMGKKIDCAYYVYEDVSTHFSFSEFFLCHLSIRLFSSKER